MIDIRSSSAVGLDESAEAAAEALQHESLHAAVMEAGVPLIGHARGVPSCGTAPVYVWAKECLGDPIWSIGWSDRSRRYPDNAWQRSIDWPEPGETVDGLAVRVARHIGDAEVSLLPESGQAPYGIYLIAGDDPDAGPYTLGWINWTGRRWHRLRVALERDGDGGVRWEAGCPDSGSPRRWILPFTAGEMREKLEARVAREAGARRVYLHGIDHDQMCCPIARLPGGTWRELCVAGDDAGDGAEPEPARAPCPGIHAEVAAAVGGCVAGNAC